MGVGDGTGSSVGDGVGSGVGLGVGDGMGLEVGCAVGSYVGAGVGHCLSLHTKDLSYLPVGERAYQQKVVKKNSQPVPAAMPPRNSCSVQSRMPLLSQVALASMKVTSSQEDLQKLSASVPA